MKINIHIGKKPNQGKRIRDCTFGTPLFNNFHKAYYLGKVERLKGQKPVKSIFN